MYVLDNTSIYVVPDDYWIRYRSNGLWEWLDNNALALDGTRLHVCATQNAPWLLESAKLTDKFIASMRVV